VFDIDMHIFLCIEVVVFEIKLQLLFVMTTHVSIYLFTKKNVVQK